MKLTFSVLVMVACLFVCARTVDAQSLYGRTTVHYDENTRYMTATASTEVDFLAQEFYQGYVNIRLTDGDGNTMAVANVVTRTVTASCNTQINSQLGQTVANIPSLARIERV